MRLYTLDSLKAIAAFFVITLHVGLYHDLSPIYGEVIRLTGRWAVPFFFMATGYFIGVKQLEAHMPKHAIKIGKIFIITSLIYIPYSYLKHDFSMEHIASRASSDTLIMSGMSFHLWYLSSLFFGLITFYVLHYRLSTKSMLTLSMLIISGYFIVDLYPSITEHENWVRHLISIPCLFFGYRLSRVNAESISLPLTTSVALLSLAGMYVLPYYLDGDQTRDIMLRQFPIFVIPFCMVLLLLAIKLNANDNPVAKVGRDYSLLIYTCHPIFMYGIETVLAKHNMDSDIVIALATFVVATGFAVLLKRVCRPAFRVLNGG
ncbi:acyltransferase family protein [Vibrio palustris]|uniref:Inner membrane protein YiaH n=1 Tax=Vibrio palustris TaxID=1918946 RepID=A0A1R4B4X0_9VIBR|nr:acyltransferase [Vibrio palustris]SJL83978.1 Inner membrane protein YiaH [Vibrio palustris]